MARDSSVSADGGAVRPTTPDAKAFGDSIGVWLQLEPGQHLVGEGIGQHLGSLLNGFAAMPDRRIVLYAPIWARRTIRNFLKQFNIPRQRVDVVLCGNRHLARYLTPPRTYRSRRPEAARLKPLHGLPRWLRVMVAPLTAWVAWDMVRRAPAATTDAALEKPKRVNPLLPLYAAIMRTLVFSEMAARAERDRRVKAVFLPIGNWDTARLVEKKPVIAQIPDLVFLEFPDVFDRRHDVNAVSLQIQRMSRHAAAVITVSDHVRQKHVIEFMGAEPEKVFSFQHGPMRVDHHLARYAARAKVPVKELPAMLVRRFQRRRLDGEKYLSLLGGSIYWQSCIRDPEIWRKRQLFFPTQNRPYKNIRRVVRAIGLLRDRHGLDCNLLLTGDIGKDDDIIGMIHQENLYSNIMPLPRLNQVMHGSFYAISDLAVAASIFEGGFPFLFSEALSVGTPVVMARNVVTEPELPEAIASRMLFDPFSPEEIADRIAGALLDPQLLPDQDAIWRERTATRTWLDVATDYDSACDYGATVFAGKEARRRARSKRRR